ncbi:M12 family metallopeptidase [Salinimicrobium sp. CAU 1759]
MRKLKLQLILPALALLASCSKDAPEEMEVLEGTDSNVEASIQSQTEVAYPNPGSVTEVFFAGQKLPVEQINGDFIYQGDILLPPDMVSPNEVKLVFEKGEEVPANKSVGRTSGRWPDNTVYYAIEGSLENKARVYDAIKHWESNTNLDFVERTSQSNYIYFVTGSGCSSYVGMVGGRQNITLSSACSTGNTIHEIGHAIGLWHEQSRVDRENFVTINYSNIQGGREHNFHTYAQQGMDGDEYTTSLDFGSIMMYGPYSFSSNGKPTIVKKDGSTFSVQRSALSTGDKTGVNNMYPFSSGGTETVEPTYVNGQYYTIEGLIVLRYYDRWFYKSKWGILEVELIDGTWYYV